MGVEYHAPHGWTTSNSRFGPWHVAALAPRNDSGGPRHRVVVEIPEALDAWSDAMCAARELAARVLLVCDTHKQAEDAAEAAGRALPEHVRIPLERVLAGAWGRLS